MERQEIETFLALCEELHFGRTAKRLRIYSDPVLRIRTAMRRLAGSPLRPLGDRCPSPT